MTDPLTDAQIRVLGCLVEKERTTPDQYPLSTNALIAACNQRTNRDPVVAFDQRVVDAALLELRLAGLARSVRPTGSRAHKHRHVLDEAWGLHGDELAVLAVLMLRGPQTPGELRARTDRYTTFTELSEVEALLGLLAATETALVANLGRGPGQSQDRWAHTLAGRPGSSSEESVPTRADATLDGARPAATPVGAASAAGDVAARLARVERALQRIADELGITIDEPTP